MMTELSKDVYGQQVVNPEKPVMGIKDYIRYFDKVRGTMAGSRRNSSGRINDDDLSYDDSALGRDKNDGNYSPSGNLGGEPLSDNRAPLGGERLSDNKAPLDCNARSMPSEFKAGTGINRSSPKKCFENDFQPVKENGDSSKAKSKIEILKEQIFREEESSYKDNERMEEVEKLCKLRAVEDNVREVSGEIERKKEVDNEDKTDTSSNLFKTRPVISEDLDSCLGMDVSSPASISSSTQQSCDNNDRLLRELDSLDTNEFMEFDEKLNEKIEEMNKGSDQAGTQGESESLDVITKDIMADNVFSNTSKIDEDLKSHFSILKDEIETQFKERYVRDRAAVTSRLPNSSEIAGDFRNFKTRPALFKCQLLSCSTQISSMNLFTKYVNEKYSNAEEKTLSDSLTITIPLFSKADLSSQRHVFRGPGDVLSSRPSLRLHSSILTEQGILYYFNVFNESGSSWYIRKELKIKPDISAAINGINALSDDEFNRFVVSDVVSAVFRRTSYVYYNNRIMLLRFVGKSLCVCDNKKIVHVVRLDDISIVKLDGARPTFVVGETAFGCSCVIERDEWIGCIGKVVDEKC